MDENKNIELTKEQLDEVAGGVGGKDGGRKGGDLDHVRCPNCGAPALNAGQNLSPDTCDRPKCSKNSKAVLLRRAVSSILRKH